MEHIYILKKSNENFILESPSGPMFAFRKQIFKDSSIIRGLAIEMVKNDIPSSTDTIILMDKTKIPFSTCTKCGSKDVEVKAWLCENTGYANPVEGHDDEDTWCPVCEGHHGITMKTGEFQLYNSETKK